MLQNIFSLVIATGVLLTPFGFAQETSHSQANRFDNPVPVTNYEEDLEPFITSFASETPAGQTDEQTNIRVKIELQMAPAYWQTLNDSVVVLKHNKITKLTVNFKGEPYRIDLLVKGRSLDEFAEGGKSIWALNVTRQDYVNDHPQRRKKSDSFLTETGTAVERSYSGRYDVQFRNLRVTFTL